MKIKHLILALALICIAVASNAQDTPAVGKRFPLPLADGSAVPAVFLPGHDSSLNLVYATKQGKLVILRVDCEDPEPRPDPLPPPPPVTSLTVGVCHQPTKSTVGQRRVMADPAWRTAIPPPHSFGGIVPIDYVNPNTGTTPPKQKRFIDAARGSALPCLILLNENNAVVFTCPLPTNSTKILELIRKHGGPTNAKTDNRRRKLPRSPARKNGTPRNRGKN